VPLLRYSPWRRPSAHTVQSRSFLIEIHSSRAALAVGDSLGESSVDLLETWHRLSFFRNSRRSRSNSSTEPVWGILTRWRGVLAREEVLDICQTLCEKSACHPTRGDDPECVYISTISIKYADSETSQMDPKGSA